MTTTPRRETAKIYQFPRRPRAAGVEAPRCDRSTPAPLVCDYGAWYHEAAIQEDLRGRKI